MIGGIPPRLVGRVVAHAAGGWSLVRIEEPPGHDREGPFPTELLPPECRRLGSYVLLTWNPYSAACLPDTSDRNTLTKG